jgi:hypothetical protein
MARLKRGDRIGPCELADFIDAGGNAEVWLARHDTFGDVALKVLKTKQAQSEPYARFRQEVETHKRIGERAGVLPLLDADVPAAPSASKRAWLAMPRADRLDVALRGASVETVADAMAGIAETLAGLLEEFGLGHRDLKPSNLYRYRDKPAVGDFGLVDVPGADELTEAGRHLGPWNFTAYEMLVDPINSAAAPADVYSFGKTLWVLISEQRWAPLGEQRADNRAFSLDQYRTHARISLLDELIERCTRHVPEDRPSMAEVARDLRAWLRAAAQAETNVDLSSWGQRVRELAAPRLTEQDRRRRLEEIAAEQSDRLASLLRPLDMALAREYPLAETDIWDEATYSDLRYHGGMGLPRIINEEARATRLPAGDETIPFVLTIGRYVAVTDDGLLHVAGSYNLGHDRVLGGGERWETGRISVPADSLEAHEAIGRVARELIDQADQWTRRFADALRQMNASESPEGDAMSGQEHSNLTSEQREQMRDERARETETNRRFLEMRGSADQEFSVRELVADVDDPKFDEVVARRVLDELVQSGEVLRRRVADGDEYTLAET